MITSILLDNDIVLKVSQYDVVQTFLSTCTIPGNTYVLPTLKYALRLKDADKALQRIGSREGIDAVNCLLKSVSELEYGPPSHILSIFQNEDEIDTGEAILFAAALSLDESLTITGDKKALTALAKLSIHLGVVENLKGRLKCLEQSIAEMLLSGHDAELTGKIPDHAWDRTMRICFHSLNVDSILECLKSYYGNLNRECNQMLAPFPE